MTLADLRARVTWLMAAMTPEQLAALVTLATTLAPNAAGFSTPPLTEPPQETP